MADEMKPLEVAHRLEAIANHMNDNVSAMTETGKLLLCAAKHLKYLDKNTCGEGFIGCRGGPNCDYDHK